MRRQASETRPAPSMVARLMDELRRQSRYSLDDFVAAMAERLQPWSPGREELQRHLTRRQAVRLLGDDRLVGAVRLDPGLSAVELGASAVISNALMLMSELTESGGAKLTEAGFFNRSFVMRIASKLDWPDFNWQEIMAISKTVRESDLTPIWFLHGVLKLGGLLYVRRGVANVGKHGRELMAPQRAGALQAALFRTAWRDLNLAELGGIGLGSRLQPQGNLALYMIDRLADDWIDSERLLHAAIVPDDEILAAPEYLPLYALEGCLLRPLRWFGLIEIRLMPTEVEWRSRRELRKTPLYDRFFTFDPGPA